MQDSQIASPQVHDLLRLDSELAERNLPGVRAVPVVAGVLPKILRLAQQEQANA